MPECFRSATREEMRAIDAAAIRDFGIPSIVLMENAGLACAKAIRGLCGPKRKVRAVVFAGKGNNGGDGFVIARHLVNYGADVAVFFFQPPVEMKPDPRINFRILKRMRVALWDCSKSVCWARLQRSVARAGVLVDALFGTGLAKAVEDPYKRVIELINGSGKKVLSVDVPSGLNADTGEAMGACVRADLTVTFGLPKKGFVTRSARRYLGRLEVAGISLPGELLMGHGSSRRRAG